MIFFLLPPSEVLFCRFRFLARSHLVLIRRMEPSLIFVDSSVDSDGCMSRRVVIELLLSVVGNEGSK